MHRREFLGATSLVLTRTSSWGALYRPNIPRTFSLDPITQLEIECKARIGVALHETGSEQRIVYRGNEHFAMCSTYKLLLAGAILARVQRRKESLDRRIIVGDGDVIGHSPFVAKRAGATVTVQELCQAMMVESDNGAANLMLSSIGGPAALTQFLRGIGDSSTRLDRTEPTVNESMPGELRDTTTPIAMLGSVERLLLGPVLLQTYRNQLIRWMIECQTGLRRLRDGLPEGWRAGDKTGTGVRGTYNDIAICWQPNRAPLIVACYITDSNLEVEAANLIFRTLAIILLNMLIK